MAPPLWEHHVISSSINHFRLFQETASSLAVQNRLKHTAYTYTKATSDALVNETHCIARASPIKRPTGEENLILKHEIPLIRKLSVRKLALQVVMGGGDAWVWIYNTFALVSYPHWREGAGVIACVLNSFSPGGWFSFGGLCSSINMWEKLRRPQL